MATEFICAINKTGEDYGTLAAFETATQADLTSAATKVFSHGGITGVVGDGASVTGQTSSATATVCHCSATQIMLKNISGTFQAAEVVQVSGGNSVTISDAGDSVIAVAECYDDDGALNENSIIFSGSTTGSSNYYEIRAAVNDRHSGTLTSGAAGTGFRIEASGGNISAISSSVAYTRIRYLQVVLSIGNDYNSSSIINVDYVEGCLIYGYGTYDCSGITHYTSGRTTYYFNNILTANVDNQGSGINSDWVTAYVYNNTVYNFNVGITGVGHSGTNVILKNNISYANTTCYSGSLNTGEALTNISSDNTSPNAAYRSKTLTFTDTSTLGAEDLHLVSGDTDAIDDGTDLSGDANLPFSIDVDRVTRSGAWDIGADEYVAAGGGSVQTYQQTFMTMGIG